jgi:hypothetical protein
MAGCPKCAIDLVRVNKHKPTRVHPNGFETFESLVAGERLNIPDKWSNGELDHRPRAYFAALPYHDGVTPSSLGALAAGVLADYATLDAASTKVGALSTMNDQPFSDSVGDTASSVDAAVREISGGTAGAYAQSARDSAGQARQLNTISLLPAISSGDQSASFQARRDILNALSNALVSARSALKAFYDEPQSGFSADMVTSAQEVATAIAADPSYCASVARSGSAVNSAVHDFKAMWNSSHSDKVPINTGSYEQATAAALARVLGSAPSPCPPRSPSSSAAVPSLITVPSKGLSTGAVVGISLLTAGAVGGGAFLMTQKPNRKRRKARRRS